MKLSLLKILAGVFIATLLLLIVAYAFSLPILQAILAIPVLLFFPGFTLIAVITPGTKDLRATTRIILSFVLSIAVDSTIGLVINYTPAGITFNSVIISISIFVLVMALIAIIRQLAIPASNRSALVFGLQFKNTFSSGLNTGFFSIMVIAVLGALVTALFFAFSPKNDESFTQFLIVEQGNGALYSADGFPGNDEVTVTLQIINHEGIQTDYRIQTMINGASYTEVDSVTLGDGQQWQNSLTMPAPMENETQIEFKLFKNDEPDPYLESLRIWIDRPQTDNTSL